MAPRLSPEYYQIRWNEESETDRRDGRREKGRSYRVLDNIESIIREAPVVSITKLGLLIIGPCSQENEPEFL